MFVFLLINLLFLLVFVLNFEVWFVLQPSRDWLAAARLLLHARRRLSVAGAAPPSSFALCARFSSTHTYQHLFIQTGRMREARFCKASAPRMISSPVTSLFPTTAPRIGAYYTRNRKRRPSTNEHMNTKR